MKSAISYVVQSWRKGKSVAKTISNWRRHHAWRNNDNVPAWFLHLWKTLCSLKRFYFGSFASVLAVNIAIKFQERTFSQLVDAQFLLTVVMLIATIYLAQFWSIQDASTKKFLVDREVAASK